jgi:hypothetical protein
MGEQGGKSRQKKANFFQAPQAADNTGTTVLTPSFAAGPPQEVPCAIRNEADTGTNCQLRLRLVGGDLSWGGHFVSPLRYRNKKGCRARDWREAAFFRFQGIRGALEFPTRRSDAKRGNSPQAIDRIERKRLENIFRKSVTEKDLISGSRFARLQQLRR